MTPALTPTLSHLPVAAAPQRAPRRDVVAAQVIAETIQRTLHDDGNARIGVRMSAFFRLDDEREDEA